MIPLRYHSVSEDRRPQSPTGVYKTGEMSESRKTASILKIAVPWKNTALAISMSGFLLIDLALFSVKNTHVLQYLALSFGLVVSMTLTVRAVRVGVVVQGQEIELRRLLWTKRIPVADVKSVDVGSEITPITRYYLVFELNSGRVIKMKDVFLWGVTKNAKLRAEDWSIKVRESIAV